MVASRKGVEVWVANQPTGRSLLRQLIVDEQPGAPNEGLVALQTAELLRTTLLSRSDLPPAPPRTAAAPPPEITVPAAPPPPPFGGLQAAAGVMYSPAAGGAAGQLWITLRQVVRRPFGIAIDASGPLRTTSVTGPEGSAAIGAWLAGASLYLDYEQPGGVSARGAVGAAAIRVTADGMASLPLVARSQSATAGAVYASADVGFHVAWWLRLGARGIVGVVPGGITLHFAGNDAGTWGRPFLTALGLAEISWR
jgi:hypothetical protein